MRVVVRDERSLWTACERLEYEVFRESGYVARCRQKRILPLDRYETAEFIAAFAHADGREGEIGARPIGVMRVVFAPDTPRVLSGIFPTVDAAEALRMDPQAHQALLRMDPRELVDIASMAVRRTHRTSGAALAMISAVIDRTRRLPPRRYGLAAIDTTFYGKLKSLSLPWQSLGPSTMYWGSMTTAAMLDSSTVVFAEEESMVTKYV